MFGCLSFLSLLLALNGVHSQSAASIASQRAIDYIKSQKDPFTGTWPRGESAAAVLGLIAQNPKRFELQSKTPESKLESHLETQNIAVDFLTFVRNIQTQGLRGNPLQHIDDTTLLEIGAAVKGLCGSLRDYHGYNLMFEFIRRLHRPNNIMYGGMALAICNARRKFSLPQIQKLKEVTMCDGCEFFVEAISMNLLAVSCIAANTRPGSDRRKIVDELTPNLAQRLIAVQNSNGGFGGFIPTALAMQALIRTDSRYVNRDVIQSGLRRLIQYQKPNGSFGDSISNTALALPALTGQTAVDLYTNKCPVKEQKPEVNIIIQDNLVSQQSMRVHIAPIQQGTTLYEAISDFTNANRETLDVVIMKRETPKPYILSINGLARRRLFRWKISKVANDGTETDISSSWKHQIISGKSSYKITLTQ